MKSHCMMGYKLTLTAAPYLCKLPSKILREKNNLKARWGEGDRNAQHNPLKKGLILHVCIELRNRILGVSGHFDQNPGFIFADTDPTMKLLNKSKFFLHIFVYIAMDPTRGNSFVSSALPNLHCSRNRQGQFILHVRIFFFLTGAGSHSKNDRIQILICNVKVLFVFFFLWTPYTQI